MQNLIQEYAALYSDEDILNMASEILFKRMNNNDALTNPNLTKEYLKTKLALKASESFCILYLDNRHRVIAFEELFQGTINGASVYPREVVKACLAHNAAAVILAHNHPSGVAEPSQADISLTRTLKQALSLVEIRTLDHIVIGGNVAVSFADRGLL